MREQTLLADSVRIGHGTLSAIDQIDREPNVACCGIEVIATPVATDVRI